jgi:mannose-6-phosphate isomerase-like protein (cupin superfamily)
MPVFNRDELPFEDDIWTFVGRANGGDVSILIVDAPPGSGPRLHSHPYQEIFVVQEGSATFVVGEAAMELRGGQIAVVPAGVPHKFTNTGSGRLRQIDIHVSPDISTTWLED